METTRSQALATDITRDTSATGDHGLPMTHTPAPWRIRTQGNVGNAIEAQSGKNYGEGDDGYRIVCTFQECTNSDLYHEQRKNCVANGEFIVRAVNAHYDMLAALKAITRLYVELADSGDCGNWDSAKVAEVIAARAIIAKAECRS